MIPYFQDPSDKNVGSCTNQVSFPDRSFYEGEWRHGLREGQGTFRSKGGHVYSGEWKENVLHGFGKQTWKTGA
jgi:hypothetical protein